MIEIIGCDPQSPYPFSVVDHGLSAAKGSVPRPWLSGGIR